jgi:fructose/tagatose bisphosphate aldolase
MLYKDTAEMKQRCAEVVKISPKGVKVLNEERLKQELAYEIFYNIALNENPEIRQALVWLISEIAKSLGIVPASIQSLYEARGKGRFSAMTVPAINLRGLTCDLARAIIKSAMKCQARTFVFEIAKSEIAYTFQRPAEYTSACLCAAIIEGYRGPVFVQGDHFQVNAKRFSQDRNKEIEGLKQLIKEAIEAEFYNIDIDSSTIVDLNQKSVEEQQRQNFEVAAQLTAYIRSLQPKGVEVSVGGEIGEVGGKNSTVEELRAFMQGYAKTLAGLGRRLKGISKISVQTGTTHGGVVLPDGTIAKVQLDFETLEKMSEVAKKEFGLSGAVQHGASTLPPEAFHRFPETDTAEVHLATEYQNMVYESKNFPNDLREKIYAWLKKECQAERQEGQTDEQFIYKTRKKGFGPFKKELMDLPEKTRANLRQEIENKFDFLFQKLNAAKSKDLVKKFVRPTVVKKEIPAGLKALV